MDAHAAIDRLISKVASVYRVKSTLHQSLSRFKTSERANARIMDVSTVLHDYALQNASTFEDRGRGLGFFDTFKSMLAPKPECRNRQNPDLLERLVREGKLTEGGQPGPSTVKRKDTTPGGARNKGGPKKESAKSGLRQLLHTLRRGNPSSSRGFRPVCTTALLREVDTRGPFFDTIFIHSTLELK